MEFQQVIGTIFLASDNNLKFHQERIRIQSKLPWDRAFRLLVIHLDNYPELDILLDHKRVCNTV
jgi:hypothetical protein